MIAYFILLFLSFVSYLLWLAKHDPVWLHLVLMYNK